MSEVGIIGQMYEDRRTKKVGKLVERDDKYKTLLFETADGKTFNVSFGGFKSNWRKCAEPEQTVEEAMVEVEIAPADAEPVCVVEAVETPVVPKKADTGNVNERFVNTTLQVVDFIKSFDNSKLAVKVLPLKRGIIIKFGSRRVFEIYYKARDINYNVCMCDVMYNHIKNLPYVEDVKDHTDEGWHFKISVTIGYDNLGDFLNNTRDYVIDYMCNNAEKAKSIEREEN